MNKTKLYALLSLACLLGYVWLWVAQSNSFFEGASMCILKNTTGLPCPSCGVTRSVSAIWEGAFQQAFWLNPLGFLVATIMLFCPLLLLYDLIFRTAILYSIYFFVEEQIKKKKIAIPLLILILINWIWNIFKNV